MLQIVKNYLIIFIIPFLVGVAVRLLCRRVNKAYFITAAFAVLAIIAWVVAFVVPSHGSELYALIAAQATTAAVGTLLLELVLQIKKAVQRNKKQ